MGSPWLASGNSLLPTDRLLAEKAVVVLATGPADEAERLKLLGRCRILLGVLEGQTSFVDNLLDPAEPLTSNFAFKLTVIATSVV